MSRKFLWIKATRGSHYTSIVCGEQYKKMVTRLFLKTMYVFEIVFGFSLETVKACLFPHKLYARSFFGAYPDLFKYKIVGVGV